jgi:hypothetical protein
MRFIGSLFEIAGSIASGACSWQGFLYQDGASSWAMRTLLLLLAGLILTAPFTAAAVSNGETVLFVSKKPYWEVGQRDKALSQACALGRFNIQKASRLVARFAGPSGADTLNVAKGTGINLVDPDHRAKPNEDYYFRNQNSTSCEVYVGGRKSAIVGKK